MLGSSYIILALIRDALSVRRRSPLDAVDGCPTRLILRKLQIKVLSIYVNVVEHTRTASLINH